MDIEENIGIPIDGLDDLYNYLDNLDDHYFDTDEHIDTLDEKDRDSFCFTTTFTAGNGIVAFCYLVAIAVYYR